MSYIQATHAGFTQVVMSVWYRVPGSSLDKANAAYVGEDGVPLDGIVPLVVMGKRGKLEVPWTFKPNDHKVTQYTSSVQGVVSYGEHQHTIEVIGMDPPRARSTFVYSVGASLGMFSSTQEDFVAAYTIDGDAKPSDPTFIGIGMSGELVINIETNKKPDATGIYLVTTSIDPGFYTGHGFFEYSGPIPTPVVPPNAAYPIGTYVYEYDFYLIPFIDIGNEVVVTNTTDYAYFTAPASITKAHYNTEDISNKILPTGNLYSENIYAGKPNHWHHLLICMDLKQIKARGTSSNSEVPRPEAKFVDSASRLFVALDDKNYDRYDLTNNWPDGSADNNAIIPQEAMDILASRRGDDQNEEPYPMATYTLDTSVPSGTIGLPAHGEFVDNVYHVELAEFQVWFGKTIDTSREEVRRAFIDYKRDANNQPIADKNGVMSLQPAPVSVTEKLMGKPDILLHGSSKWIKGKNTGSGSQFSPTGEIIKYKPDPTLTGPQGAPQ